jgi:DNA-binding GntR family transcriptional regulator
VGVDNEGGAETNDESKALSQFVYERLREGIISGRYAAGEPLRERDIASEFNVSRIPIRTALPRLEVGGFVRVLPRRTAVSRTSPVARSASSTICAPCSSP